MLLFLAGLLVGGGGTFFVLLVFGMCTVAKRADEQADLARNLEGISDPEPEPKRKSIAIMVRGDESVVN